MIMIHPPTYQYGLRAEAKKVLNMERNRFDHACLNVLHYFTVDYDIMRIRHGLRAASRTVCIIILGRYSNDEP